MPCAQRDWSIIGYLPPETVTRYRPVFKLPTPLVLFMLLLALWQLGGRPALAQTGQQPGIAETTTVGVNALVRGIISYTRWPTPRSRLRLCLVGETEHDAMLRQPVDWFVAEGTLDLLPLEFPQLAPEQCDAVYVGRSVDVGQLSALIKSITGEAILSIGEDEGFCSAGGMFCLEQGETGFSFAANLDAIARSGLKVNPMVLRLTRQLLKE